MHIGRSHHSASEIAGSVIGGFGISFLVFGSQVILQSSKVQRAQLLAGDPTANRDMPTTLNAVRAVTEGTSPMLQAMGSYVWWIAVIVGGLIATYVLLKMIRRYAI